MSDKNYLSLIVTHIAIGFLIFKFPFFAKIYAGLIVVLSLYFVIKNKNKNNEALHAAAYIVGIEVFLRTVNGNPIHEYGKYFVILFIVIGIFYNGIPKKTNPYWVFLFFLIPSIITAIEILKFNVRTTILFNISGPICLGICSLYMYKRKISFEEINSILLAIGMPVLSYVAYLFLKCPIYDLPIPSTESNYVLSGGLTPNQTATLLGFGMFVFTARLFLISSSRKIMLCNVFIIVYIYYRCLLTFSRGGTLTGIIIILLLFCLLFIHFYQYKTLKYKIGSFLLLLTAVFFLTSFQTDNLLWKRYADQNPSGLKKSEDKNGRNQIAMQEILLFEKSPIFGIGVGKGKEIRKTETGKTTNSHSEITRMLAEHGLFGIASLLILILTPFILFVKKNKKDIYLICFFTFWLLTINHSAMRIAAPAFIYALSLLDIDFIKNNNSTGY